MSLKYTYTAVRSTRNTVIFEVIKEGQNIPAITTIYVNKFVVPEPHDKQLMHIQASFEEEKEDA